MFGIRKPPRLFFAPAVFRRETSMKLPWHLKLIGGPKGSWAHYVEASGELTFIDKSLDSGFNTCDLAAGFCSTVNGEDDTILYNSTQQEWLNIDFSALQTNNQVPLRFDNNLLSELIFPMKCEAEE